MIEYEIKKDLERLTGMKVYPLMLPENTEQGATYQRISDARISSGLVQTSLVTGRFQISLYLTDDYPALLQLEKHISKTWEAVRHDVIGSWPVQSVTRGPLLQRSARLTSNRILYCINRDFLICYTEDAT